MCEICNIENDMTDYLMGEDITVNIYDDSGYTYFDADSELSVNIHRDVDGYHYLEFEYACESIEARRIDGRIRARMHIDYCPFCGEKLKHKPKCFVFKNE